VLLRFASGDDEHESTLLLRDSAAIAAISEYACTLKASATPLIESIAQEDRITFQERLVALESAPGDRGLVRDLIPSYLIQSEQLASWWTVERDAPESSLDSFQYLVRQRQEMFQADAQKYRQRYIAIKHRLEDIVRTSLQVKEGLILQEGAEHFDPDYVLAYIQTCIDMLNRFPNYEVALLDDHELGLIRANSSDSIIYWLVKGTQGVQIETWLQTVGGESRHLHVAISESSIASAFQEHFQDVWNRVSARNRDKDYVKWWLERLVEPLRTS
jgi:hypothetical protein